MQRGMELCWSVHVHTLFFTKYVDHVHFSWKSCTKFAPRTGSCTLSECLTSRWIHISIVVTEEAKGRGVVVCWWPEFNIHPIRGANPPCLRVSLLLLLPPAFRFLANRVFARSKVQIEKFTMWIFATDLLQRISNGSIGKEKICKFSYSKEISFT